MLIIICHHSVMCVYVGFLVQLLEALMEQSTTATVTQPPLSVSSMSKESTSEAQSDVGGTCEESVSKRSFRKTTVGKFKAETTRCLNSGD